MVLGWERRTQAHHPRWGNLVLGPEALPGPRAVAYTLGSPHCPLSCPTPISWADRPATAGCQGHLPCLPVLGVWDVKTGTLLKLVS